MSEVLTVYEPEDRFLTMVRGLPRIWVVGEDGTPIEQDPATFHGHPIVRGID